MPIQIGSQACAMGPGGDRDPGEGRSDYEKYLPMGQSHSYSPEVIDLPGRTPLEGECVWIIEC